MMPSADPAVTRQVRDAPRASLSGKTRTGSPASRLKISPCAAILRSQASLDGMRGACSTPRCRLFRYHGVICGLATRAAAHTGICYRPSVLLAYLDQRRGAFQRRGESGLLLFECSEPELGQRLDRR